MVFASTALFPARSHPGARQVVDDEGYELRKKMNSLGRLATPKMLLERSRF